MKKLIRDLSGYYFLTEDTIEIEIEQEASAITDEDAQRILNAIEELKNLIINGSDVSFQQVWDLENVEGLDEVDNYAELVGDYEVIDSPEEYFDGSTIEEVIEELEECKKFIKESPNLTKIQTSKNQFLLESYRRQLNKINNNTQKLNESKVLNLTKLKLIEEKVIDALDNALAKTSGSIKNALGIKSKPKPEEFKAAADKLRKLRQEWHNNYFANPKDLVGINAKGNEATISSDFDLLTTLFRVALSQGFIDQEDIANSMKSETGYRMTGNKTKGPEEDFLKALGGLIVDIKQRKNAVDASGNQGSHYSVYEPAELESKIISAFSA